MKYAIKHGFRIHKKNLLIIFALIGGVCFAADLVKPPVPVSLKFTPAADAKPGGTVTAVVEVDIKKPWHIFGANPGVEGLTPAELTIDSSTGATISQVTPSKPATVYSKIFQKNLSLYEDKMTFNLTFKIDPAAGTGIPLRGSLHYQACSDTTCLPPKREPFVATQEVVKP